MSPEPQCLDAGVAIGPARTGNGIIAAIVRGFTLVEMLVVVLIMGIAVGLVSASAQPDDRTLLRLEADRLAQLLDLAATESRLTGKPIAWTADGPAYRFWQFSEDLGWTPVVDEVLRARDLPQGMTISDMRMENIRFPVGTRVEFSPYGSAPSFNIGMSLGTARYSVVNSPVGDVRVLAEGESLHDEKSLRR